jgi:hypothetical protein
MAKKNTEVGKFIPADKKKTKKEQDTPSLDEFLTRIVRVKPEKKK